MKKRLRLNLRRRHPDAIRAVRLRLVAAQRERRSLRRSVEQLKAAGGRHRGCLVCLRNDGGFVSEEHVIPEGAGNREVVLPPGWVCDRCNHGPLALIDAALLDFPGIAMMRVLRGVPGKGDRLPEVRWSNARGYIDVIRRRPTLTPTTTNRAWRSTSEGGKLRLQKSWGASVRQRAATGRALYKIALEWMLLTEGPDVAYGTALDDLREAVLGETPAHGWFGLVNTSGEPHDRVTLRRQTVDLGDDPCLVLIADFYSVVLFTEFLWRDTSLAEGVRRAAGLGAAPSSTSESLRQSAGRRRGSGDASTTKLPPVGGKQAAQLPPHAENRH